MINYRTISPDYNNEFVNLSKSDIENSNLKGEVKSITLIEKNLEELSQSTYLRLPDSKIYLFDIYGRQIGFKLICDGNKIELQRDFIYENQNLISIISIGWDGNISSIDDYTYNDNRQIIQEYNQYNDRLYLATYNNDGYLIRVDYKFGMETSKLPRGKSTRHLAENIFIPRGIDPREIKERRWDILRDSKRPDHIIEVKVKSKEGLIQKTTFEYDNKDNIIYSLYVGRDDRFQFSKEFTFDKFQNEIKTIFTGKDKITTIDEIDYTYDNQNNWISCSHYKNGELWLILTRIIEYYS